LVEGYQQLVELFVGLVRHAGPVEWDPRREHEQRVVPRRAQIGNDLSLVERDKTSPTGI
jgi:hypothetical protein